MAFIIAKHLTLLCLLISLSHQLDAASLDCSNLSATECKVNFGEQFEKDFKVLHTATLKDLFNIFEPIAAVIIEELPKNDAIADALKNSVDKLRIDLQDLNEKTQDNKKINEIMSNIKRHVQWSPDVIGTQDVYEKSLEKHNVKDILGDRLNKFAIDGGKLYAELYAKLRPEDLQKYPEYDELKAIMDKMQDSKKDPAKLTHYASIREYLATDFQLPYFSEVRDIFL